MRCRVQSAVHLLQLMVLGLNNDYDDDDDEDSDDDEIKVRGGRGVMGRLRDKLLDWITCCI